MGFLHVVRARKWTIIVAAFVVPSTDVVASMLQGLLFRGDAKVLVTAYAPAPARSNSALGEPLARPERGLQTQVQPMQLRRLSALVIRALTLRAKTGKLLECVAITASAQPSPVTGAVSGPLQFAGA